MSNEKLFILPGVTFNTTELFLVIDPCTAVTFTKVLPALVVAVKVVLAPEEGLMVPSELSLIDHPYEVPVVI